MKTKNSIVNSVFAIISNILLIIVNFISQSIFIRILGKEYLGLNSLFTSIISMLSIMDLGIGSAIIYNLYKPLKENDKVMIGALLNFYKKAYNIIAVIILFIGLCIMPFLNYFIKDITVSTNISIIYLLFLIDTVITYLLSYKRSILYADQKNYIVNTIHIITALIIMFFQTIILFTTKNYYIYLIIKIIAHIVENISVSKIASKKYKFINEPSQMLDKKTERDILKKVKAMFFHKVGAFIVSGSDNLIISKYLGIIQVGLYSNYYIIIDAVQRLFNQFLTAITPSVGNLLTENNSEKAFSIFKKIRFLNFWIATFTGTAIFIIMDSFITIWIGDKYLLPFLVLSVLVFNYYQKSMRTSYSVFKEAAGIYYEDRFVPLIESTLNIISSLILLKWFGLAGVFMGTIVSGLVLWCYSYPKYVYKGLFNKSYYSYVKETLGYIFTFIIITTITFVISNFLVFNNIYIKFICQVLISLIVPNLILLIIFFKNDNFKYYINLIKDIIHKRKTK